MSRYAIWFWELWTVIIHSMYTYTMKKSATIKCYEVVWMLYKVGRPNQGSVPFGYSHWLQTDVTGGYLSLSSGLQLPLRVIAQLELLTLHTEHY